jgi:hypothetical protein
MSKIEASVVHLGRLIHLDKFKSLKKIYQLFINKKISSKPIIAQDMYFFVYNDIIGRSLYLSGVHEPNLTNFLYKNIKTDDVFFDIGANIGYYSLLASKLKAKRESNFTEEILICILQGNKVKARILMNDMVNDGWNERQLLQRLRDVVFEKYLNKTDAELEKVIMRIVKCDDMLVRGVDSTLALDGMVF